MPSDSQKSPVNGKSYRKRVEASLKNNLAILIGLLAFLASAAAQSQNYKHFPGAAIDQKTMRTGIILSSTRMSISKWMLKTEDRTG